MPKKKLENGEPVRSKTSQNPQRKWSPLVSVEHQSERDVSTGEKQSRMFVKMYQDARTSGLLRAMPPDLWQTLCCLATYLDADGKCWPPQDMIGRDLGLSRQAMNSRIKRLEKFRFQGNPVITIAKNNREKSSSGGMGFANNVYTFDAIASFEMFGGPNSSKEDLVSSRRDTSGDDLVSTQVDTSGLDASGADTNKNHLLNNTRSRVSSVRKGAINQVVSLFHELMGHPRSTRILPKETAQAKQLIERVGEKDAILVVEYAIREGQKTNFAMKYFGAVLLYEDKALRSIRREKPPTSSVPDLIQKALNADEKGRAEYAKWRSSQLTVIKKQLGAKKIAQLSSIALDIKNRENAKAGLKIRYKKNSTMAKTILDDHLASEFGLMTIEEWKQDKAA